MKFYNERRKLLARTTIEAPSPAAAVPLERSAILVRYPVPRAGRTRSLFERAERVAGATEAAGSSTAS